MLLLNGIGAGYVPARVISSPPALRFIRPDGAGAGTGVDWANAAPLSSLDTMMAAAGAGGVVFVLREPNGDYTQTAGVTITAAGEPGRPITVIGVNSSLVPVPMNNTDGGIYGNRQDWTHLETKPTLGNFTNTSAYGGNILLDFTATARHLVFSNLYVANLGNAFDLSGIVGPRDITFRSIDVYNVRSWIYTNETAGVRGVTIEDCRVTGFSKDAVRFRGNCLGWVIRRCFFDGNWQDGDSFETAIRCNENAGYLLIEDTFAGHCIQSADFTGGFKNGDGISTEHGNHHITIRRSTFQDITDAGIDMKGRYVVVEDCIVIGCGWSYKFFYADHAPARIVRCQSIDPVAFTGDSRSVIHLWSGGNPQVVPPYSYNDGENYMQFIDFHAEGGPDNMTAFIIETTRKHFLFNNDGGVILTTGSTKNNSPPTGSEFLYNQLIV